jgi:quercetin dioxygenase-like cupin family protein
MGVELSAGDYFRAEAGSRHGASRTAGGCLLLIQSAAEGEGMA